MEQTFIDALKKTLKGEVTNEKEALVAYSTDASIFRVEPQLVVAPKDAEDLKNLVRLVKIEKEKGVDISITARSAGTDMSGGPLTDSIVVDFTKHFNKIKSVTDERIVVEPGVYYRDLEKEMNAKNLLIPSYPASKALCTIGGMVSNNSGGEKTLAYGKTEKYVEELKVVCADGEERVIKSLSQAELELKKKEPGFEGELYRKISDLIENNKTILTEAKPNVSKNSAGYYLWNVSDESGFNLNKLIVGSQGTLCFVTEITLKPIKAKKHSRLVVVFLEDLVQLGKITNEVLKFSPESFESYDNQTLRIALQFLPDMVKKMKGSLISLGLQFWPEFVMFIRGGFRLPRLVLLIELTDDDDAKLNSRLIELQKMLVSKFNLNARVTRDEQEAEKYWTVRRESFSLLRNKVKNKQTAPFVDDVAVRPEYLPEFLPALNAIFDQYKDTFIYTIAGHVGDGNFHIIPLVELANPRVRLAIPQISEKVYALVAKYKGSITAEHNDGLIRTSYLPTMYSEKVLGLFVQTKDIFDPLGIFNPRKKVRGDLEFAFHHIK